MKMYLKVRLKKEILKDSKVLDEYNNLKPQYSKISKKAIQETRDIQSGKIKTYSSVAKMLDALETDV